MRAGSAVRKLVGQCFLLLCLLFADIRQSRCFCLETSLPQIARAIKSRCRNAWSAVLTSSTLCYPFGWVSKFRPNRSQTVNPVGVRSSTQPTCPCLHPCLPAYAARSAALPGQVTDCSNSGIIKIHIYVCMSQWYGIYTYTDVCTHTCTYIAWAACAYMH